MTGQTPATVAPQTDTTLTVSANATAPDIGARYRTYVVVLLLVVYIMNFADRQILTILIEPIRAELGLKDWQIGFLTGTAFSLFYATLGVPIARIADKWHRVNLLTICLGLWSVMTALSGVALTFAQLAAARVGVAIGEAGGSPSSLSIISDYFPKDQRTRALGLFGLGPMIGTLIGFTVGGLINELAGWRWALVAAGVPGLLLAVVVRLTLKEPKRGGSETTITPDEAPPFGQVFRILWSKPTYRLVVLASSMANLLIFTTSIWMPAYMMREFSVDTATIGIVMGLAAGICGGAGVYLGSVMSQRLHRRHERAPLIFCALAQLASVPFFALTMMANDFVLASVLLGLFCFTGLLSSATLLGLTQSLCEPRIRAMSAAVAFLVSNLIALGLGPQVIGIMSDVLREATGQEGLGTAMYGLMLPAVFSAYLLHRASKTLARDVI